jgi:nucleoside-diphosphate-sugar epimerase
LELANRGLLLFVFGSPDSLVDFVHVDNFVEALILAAQGLDRERGAPAAGQVCLNQACDN